MLIALRVVHGYLCQAASLPAFEYFSADFVIVTPSFGADVTFAPLHMPFFMRKYASALRPTTPPTEPPTMPPIIAPVSEEALAADVVPPTEEEEPPPLEPPLEPPVVAGEPVGAVRDPGGMGGREGHEAEHDAGTLGGGGEAAVGTYCTPMNLATSAFDSRMARAASALPLRLVRKVENAE